MPERRSRRGVEIARAGTYELSSGTHTFTREQLQAALGHAASQAPVIGIGHTDPRFVVAGQDGDPAFGRVVNLRLEEDGDLLVGDFDGLPEWLDDAMEIAYPRRSLEGMARGDDLRISAVKLLGTTLPGISGLADLPAALAAAAASGDTVEERARHFTQTLVASINVDDVREAYSAYANVGVDEDVDWERRAWVQKVLVDPDELIVRQDQKLYRVPWASDGRGQSTFGDRVEVVEQYVDVTASAARAAVYTAPVIPATHHEEESSMDPKTLREQLGLAENASDDDVTAKLTELSARPESTDGLLSEQDVEARIQDAVAAAAKPDADDGVLKAKLELAERKIADLESKEHDREVAAAAAAEARRVDSVKVAASSGVIAPHEVQTWTDRVKDPDKGEAYAEVLASMTPKVPTAELGGEEFEEQIAAASGDGLLPEGLSLLTPAERAARA